MHWLNWYSPNRQHLGFVLSILGGMAVWGSLYSCIVHEIGLSVGKDASADKPQSKAWYHDGSWWCILDDGQRGSYFYRLEGEVWRKAALVDEGISTRADVLSDSGELYVLTWESDGARISRYRYIQEDHCYSLLEGFPVDIRLLEGHESAVLTKDSKGILWLTYEAQEAVYISWSVSGLHWQEPEVLGSSLAEDDISSVISFDHQIGVFWSNQNSEALLFRVRDDNQPPQVWKEEESVVQGALVADDHVNLAATDGWVYAATKTSVDDAEGAVVGPTQAQIILSVRSKAAEWTVYDVAPLSSENVTRPIIVLDDEHRDAYVFYRQGDAIVYKRTSLDKIDFSHEPTIAISVPGVTLNNVTSTKQNVNSTTGLLVLATGDDGRAYHRLLPIR